MEVVEVELEVEEVMVDWEALVEMAVLGEQEGVAESEVQAFQPTAVPRDIQ
jgi:hypothetical protein